MTGFIVWNPRGGPPRTLHGTFELAAIEANRLSGENPWDRFIVAQVQHSAGPINTGPRPKSAKQIAHEAREKADQERKAAKLAAAPAKAEKKPKEPKKALTLAEVRRQK